MTYLAITGRLPALSLAELESLYGSRAITRLGNHALIEAEVDFDRLGGTIKLAKHIVTLPTINPQKVFDYCRKTLPDYIGDFPDGKIKLGVSLYGLNLAIAKQNANILRLKKAIRQTGRSVRAVPNTAAALTSAQTFHNALTSPVGLELVFVAHENNTYIGHVTNVQNIDSYTLRDRGRPKRDTFVGMLPPKLAQTIINLAVGNEAENRRREILDPFCGTGVILQEAALMGYSVYGTDISEKMVRFSRDNLNWAMEKFAIHVERQFEIGDATTHTWRQPIDTVACEGYLGRPIGGQAVTTEQLNEIIYQCNLIMRGFLKNIAPQLAPGTRLCVAAPIWQIDGETHVLPVVDELSALGYERVSFCHAEMSDLVYRRDDQPTGRHLLVVTKK